MNDKRDKLTRLLLLKLQAFYLNRHSSLNITRDGILPCQFYYRKVYVIPFG
ncbi:hypothetical protein BN136_2590 [Cronobacter universalis NCTC 9529]|nr:hypothetical protein BN136_2590 [Cronobacter universalis NCTC 9529]